MMTIEELRKEVGYDPDVRFVGGETVHPYAVWYGVWSPGFKQRHENTDLRDQYPMLGMTFDAIDWHYITDPEDMEDIIVLGDREDALFMDIRGSADYTVAEHRIVTVVAEDVIPFQMGEPLEGDHVRP